MPETIADRSDPEIREHASEPERVMVVDDFPVVCTGLRLYLERSSTIVVDCEAYDGTTALELAIQRRPPVAIIDVRLPPSDGITLAEQLRDASPETRVLLISGWFESYTIERALNAGVRGFIEKTEFPQQLAAFVHEVNRGGFCCSQSVRDQIEPFGDGYRLIQGGSSHVSRLSDRERAMLECLAQGASLKEAARLIGVTYKSADHLKQNVMKKLDVHDRVELVRRALREGWLREPLRDVPPEPTELDPPPPDEPPAAAP
jgi:DNA-binding NarL/FixJ family response regulator